MTFSSLPISKIIGDIQDLPAIPGLVRNLLQAIDNPQMKIEEISRMIGLDPGLSAKIIQLSNSAHFSPASPVHSIPRAVHVLGLSTVRAMIAGAGVIQAMGHFQDNDILSAREFWLHSFFCAILAKCLAERLNYPDPAEAYLAGLLHDVGKVALLMHAYHAYLEVVMEAELAGVDPVSMEQEIWGFTHADISAMLLKKWQLGDAIGQAIAAHHFPDLFTHLENFDLVAILHLADQFSHSKGDMETLYHQLNHAVIEWLGNGSDFGIDELETLTMDLFSLFKSCEDIFQMVVK